MGPTLISGGNLRGPIADREGADGASMGPPLISGGNIHQSALRLQSTLCFNGAAAHQRRKRATNQPAPGQCDASMGPPLISGGNAAGGGYRLAATRLQWG